MVVTHLLGGLGNQLFQYSAGRAVAERNVTRLKLDTASFADYPSRRYALEPFNIEADVLTDSDLRKLGIRAARTGLLGRALKRFGRAPEIPIITETSFEFDADVMNARAPCYMTGYWQSPKYFAPIESIIRRELTFSGPLHGENARVADRILSAVAVSIHVRRGDYVTDSHTNKYHGTCSADYYYAAEQLVKSHLGRVNLYVFSDDPEWAKRSLKFSSPTYVVEHNALEQGHEDLRLMTLCQHHIIANSTFSWWGAWLCREPDKLVIAPRNWFGEASNRTDDLIPESWIRL